MDKVEGFLEVGCNEQNEVVINHPDLKPDENGVGHIVFSANQARSLAQSLLRKAAEADAAVYVQREAERIKNIPPVDRDNQCLTDGSPVPEDRSHTKLRADGQQEGYITLCPADRAKGFVRPVRRTYVHKTCGTSTTMGQSLAETYARDPYFYSGTFCVHCAAHFPLDQFAWDDGTQVGS